MIKAINDYFSRLSGDFGDGWTRFWFTPSDPLVLGAIRLFTGMVAVYLHATLSLDLIRFFGPDGLLGARDIAPLEVGSFSYLNFVSTPAELWAVHLIGLAVLLLFAAGWQTRAMAVLALIVFLSDVHRAPMITGRTESVVAMVMCYLCLAPCGRSFSVDAFLRRKAAAASPTAVVAGNELSTAGTITTRLIQIHLALLVAMMGFSKLLGETWWNGGGVWWLIVRPDSRLVDLSWLYAYPKVIELWTHLVVLFEISFPVLIWAPLARPLLLIVGVIVWTSLALITGDITYAVMLVVASLAFVSPQVIKTIWR
jgi:hypothetical protein